MTTLTAAETTLRGNVRNFLLTADCAQVRKEIVLSLDRNNTFRAKCCLEVLAEMLPERTGGTLHEIVKKYDLGVIGGEVVTVFHRSPELNNLSDFLVILATGEATMLMPAPGVETACCDGCGHLGCQSGCEFSDR